MFWSKWMISTMLFTTTLNIMTNSRRCIGFSLGASKVDQKTIFSAKWLNFRGSLRENGTPSGVGHYIQSCLWCYFWHHLFWSKHCPIKSERIVQDLKIIKFLNLVNFGGSRRENSAIRLFSACSHCRGNGCSNQKAVIQDLNPVSD